MRTYIICKSEYVELARGILNDYKDMQIIPYLNAKENVKLVEHRIARADLVLVIVDRDFNENALLKKELEIALKMSFHNKNCLILPIVLEDTEVPEGLKNYMCINAKWDTVREYNKLKKIVNKYLENRYGITQRNGDKYSKSYLIIIMTIILEVFVVLWTLIISNESIFGIRFIDQSEEMTQIISMSLVTLSISVLFVSYYSLLQKRHREDNEKEIEAYSKRLKDAIIPEEMRDDREEEKDKKEIDALGRMMINLEDIKEFYTWSQKQAKASFVLAVAMCISGFVLMILAIVLPIVFELNFQMSIIPAIGGVITELVAGTALIVYRNSLVQLNHYHKALHEDERFLSSVNLVGKFSNVETQDEMLKEIIRSEIQMNLLGIKENTELDVSSKTIKNNLQEK